MNWSTRLIFIVLVLIFFSLQYRLWVGEGSLAEVNNLQKQIDQQKTELAALNEKNAALRAEVEDLKRGYGAIEARARSELGLIREGETYFQIIKPEKPDE